MEDACLIQCGFSLGEHWLKWEITNNMFNKSADKRGWFVSVPTFFVEVLLLLVLIKDISSRLPQTQIKVMNMHCVHWWCKREYPNRTREGDGASMLGRKESSSMLIPILTHCFIYTLGTSVIQTVAFGFVLLSSKPTFCRRAKRKKKSIGSSIVTEQCQMSIATRIFTSNFQ